MKSFKDEVLEYLKENRPDHEFYFLGSAVIEDVDDEYDNFLSTKRIVFLVVDNKKICKISIQDTIDGRKYNANVNFRDIYFSLLDKEDFLKEIYELKTYIFARGIRTVKLPTIVYDFNSIAKAVEELEKYIKNNKEIK